MTENTDTFHFVLADGSTNNENKDIIRLTPEIPPPSPTTDYNAGAKFWYYSIGVNVIPAKTRIKKTFIFWKENGYQTEPISEKQFQEWIDNDDFRDGMAVILGKVWRGENAGKYLTFIDLDNHLAIHEFCTRNGVTVPIERISRKFIIEQHKDNPNKAHVLFYSEIPFTGKSNDAAKIPDFKRKLDENLIPGFEIKGQGNHGIVFCTPSIHQDGEHYEIIGVRIPEVLSATNAHEMMEHIDNICKRYGLNYLNKRIDVDGENISQLSIRDVFNLDLKTTEGNNRHLRELRLDDSLILKLRDRMSLDHIKIFAKAATDIVNVPPKSDEEFERDWQDALKFVARIDAEKAAMEGQEALLDGCLLMEQINRSPETYAAVIKKDDYHNPTVGVKQRLRVIQEIQVERENDKNGNPKSPKYHYKHYILKAIPIPPIEIINDPLFEQTKYRIRFEYVGPGNKVIETDEPIGPYTREELKDHLLEHTNWVFKEKLLNDALRQILEGYSSRKGMAKFTTEIETEGLIWLSKENRLTLSKLTRYKPTPEESRECIKSLLELQGKFYQPTEKRPVERNRFAHFIKIGIVSVVDFARRQCGAVEGHGITPRQDLGGWSHAGKSYGYAGLALRLYRLPLHGSSKYVIGQGSVETEARLIRHTKWTTMPVILDDADFLADWQKSDQAKRCLSIIKYASNNTNPRDILTQDSKSLNLPLCAYTMFTHNSDLIDEDGFITRSTGHEFTKYDHKTIEEEKRYHAFFENHGYAIGYLGDFAIDYYIEHPEILFNDWLTIAKTILHDFFIHAGYSEEEIPQWFLDEVVDSSTSQTKLAEIRSSSIASTLHDVIQNQGWGRNKRECAIWIAKKIRNTLAAGELDYQLDNTRLAIDNVLVTATLEEKVKAAIAMDALPFFKWHDEYEVCITGSIVEELRKHGITRISHTQLPSYCTGFKYERVRFGTGGGQQRVVHVKLKDFMAFIKQPTESSDSKQPAN